MCLFDHGCTLAHTQARAQARAQVCAQAHETLLTFFNDQKFANS